MTEYIEREAALTAVDETYLDYLAVVKAAVLKIPAADVAPVVHGLWKPATDMKQYLHATMNMNSLLIAPTAAQR